MNILNNIIVTSSNSIYFDSLLTLINSVHKYSLNILDQIFVYNLGLEKSEINRLVSMKNVTVLEFSEEAKSSHTKFMEPKSYVYKTYCLYQGKNYGRNVLWVDAGAMFLDSCQVIFNKINSQDIFLVKDIHININYTHTNCRTIMAATDKELKDCQLWAGLIGYKTNGIFQQMIDDAYKYSIIPGCLDGNEENHRHDQSIMSILASRYSCPTNDIDIYGYWTDVDRNLETAKKIGSIVFAHRRGHIDHRDIIYV